MKQAIRDRFHAVAMAAQRRLRTVIIIFFVVLLIIFSGGSPLAFGVGVSSAHAVGMKSTPKPNHGDPNTGVTSTLHAAPKPTYSSLPPVPTTPQSFQSTAPLPMHPATIELTPGKAISFTGSDGRLQIIIPVQAVTAADISQAGGKLTLQVTQIAAASGSNAGGSGHISLGSYQFQLVDAKGTLITHGLHQPIAVSLHYGNQEKSFDIAHTFVVFNGSRLQKTTSAPLPNGIKSVDATLGPPSTQAVTVDTIQQTLTVHPNVGTPSSTMSWNTNSSIATFGKPDIFNVALNAGALTANEPINIPSGPGGLTPPVSLGYSSESVDEQHNAQAAAGWVGEGWSIAGGAISWSEVEQTTYTRTPPPTTTWSGQWQISDPFGTSSQLIPPATNVSTSFNDSSNGYCAGSATASPCPILWHTATESHEKIYAYVGPLTLLTVHQLCFRVYLPNGIMEEFGCTADSLQYYYNATANEDYVSNWLLDLITDPQGNQIHYTYQNDIQSVGDHDRNIVRDSELGTIEYDSPTCHNATTMCATGGTAPNLWSPLARVNFNASNAPTRRTNIFTPTANSSVEGYGWGVNNAIDGNFNSTSSSEGWTSDDSSNGVNHSEWYQLDLGSLQTISDVDISPRNDGVNAGYGFPIDFTVATSSNGTTWTTDVTKTGYAQPSSGDVQRFTFGAQTARYIRITGTNLRSNPNDGNLYRMQFAEVEAYSSSDLALTATPTASSTVEGSGWSINSAKDGSRITNSTSSNGWTSNNSLTTNHTEWYQLDLGSSHTFNEVELYPRNDGVNAGYGYPNDFTIATSPDGATWNTVTTQTSTPFPTNGIGQRYGFPAQAARYIKVTGTNLRSNPNESGRYRMQFAEVEVHNSADIALSPLVNCNTGSNLRCDDPYDLSGSGGLASPGVQNTFVLNDIQVQLRSSGAGNWNTLHDYQLSYEQSSPTSFTDPITGQLESIAGMLDLTQIQELGDDGTTSLPPRTFVYTSQTEYYEDSATPSPIPSTNCGPWGWNTLNDPSWCAMWSQSGASNDRYLSSDSNGQGLLQSYSWNNARNNTHGVPGGGSNTANPLYCNGVSPAVQATYPCNRADDSAWSHIILSQTTNTVLRLTQNGQGGQQTNIPINSTTAYNYFLSYPLTAQRCSDCTAGMYWGDEDSDSSFLDYHNYQFMGFAQASVSNPDGSVAVHKYYATEGIGLFDNTQVTCPGIPEPCVNAPWWDLGNAAHGHEYEADYYDTNGTTLLKKTTAAYTATCPPAGVSASPSVVNNGQTITWDGHLVGEANLDNPVAVCDVHETQAVTALIEGSSNSVTNTVTQTYDNYGRLIKETTASNSGGPSPIIHTASYAWNDGLNVPAQVNANAPQTISGVYFTNGPAFTDTEDSSGNRYSCAYASYDGQGYTSGQTSTITLGEVTTSDAYSNCGNAGNSFTPSGLSRTTAAYDTSGNDIASKDPDANASITGHAGCSINSISYTACMTFDATYGTLPSSTANALNQVSTVNYTSTANGGFGMWSTSTTNANGQTTSISYDPLGREISQTLPGETAGLTTKSWLYADWCSGAAAQSPCVELDETDRRTSTTTITNRAFYDGRGNLIETRKAAPGGNDVVQYSYFDADNHQTFQSVPYFVTAYTGTPGAAAYSIPDSTQAGSTSTYDGLERVTSSTDPASAHTTTTYAVVCAPAGTGDSGCYESVTSVDANGHKSAGYGDGLGRAIYGQQWTGTSASGYTLYRTTKTQYDYLGNVISTTYADGTHQATATYNALKQKTAMTDPDLGGYTLTYDPNGNLISSADPRGVSGTIYGGYDGLNRPLWKSTQSNGLNPLSTMSYDSTTGGNQGIGRLTSETFASGPSQSITGNYSYTFDGRGRQTGWTMSIGGSNYPFQIGYNDADQRTSLTYPDGDVVTTSYGTQGWLAGVTEQMGSTTNTLLNTISYTGANGATAKPTSATLDNGIYAATFGYDLDLRPAETTLTQVGNQAVLFDQVRQFDAVGNIVSSNTTLPAGTDHQAFCYDSMNRLIWAGSKGTPSCGVALTPGTLNTQQAQYTQTYSYDALDRLTQGPYGTGYTYGNSTHLDALTSVGSYSASYDAAGDMTGRNGQVLADDALRRLISWQNQATNPTQTASYAYDGAGERVKQVVTTSGTTTTTTYVGSYEEIRVTGSTTTTTKYYSAGVATVVNVNGTLSYLINDNIGSVSEALTSSGGVQAVELFLPYGSLRYTTGTMPTSYGYANQRSDPSGLLYDNARYYDATTGLFISADTVQGTNRFGYVGGNPETRTDPTGQLCGFCGISAGWGSIFAKIIAAIVAAIRTILHPPAPSGSSGGNSKGGSNSNQGGSSNSGASSSSGSSTPVNSTGSGGTTSTAPVAPGSTGATPQYAESATACAGLGNCVIFVGGVNAFQLCFKCESPFSTRVDFWKAWEQFFIGQFVGDVGFVFLEAKDATDGANKIGAQLSELFTMGYTGEITLEGQSNGATSIFHYFALEDHHQYAGQAAVHNFIALDAPEDELWFWAGGALALDVPKAADFIKSANIQGVYGDNLADGVGSVFPVYNDPFNAWKVSTGYYGSWSPVANHDFLVTYPTSDLEYIVSTQIQNEFPDA